MRPNQILKRTEMPERSAGTRAAVVVLGLAALLLGLTLPSSAWAQDEERDENGRRKPPPTRRASGTLGRCAFGIANEALKLQEENKFREALEAAKSMESRCRLSDFETATMHKQIGVFAYQVEDYPLALQSFEKAVASGALSEADQQNLKYNLGSIYLQQENYPKAVEVLEDWFRSTENPPARAYIALAGAYYQVQDTAKALNFAERAVSMTSQPEESWLTLLVGLYAENQRYKDAATYLEQLTARFPRKRYWMQLAGVYAQIDPDQKRSMMAREMAYQQGFLTTSSELTLLARQYIALDMPFKCAKLLEAEIQAERVEQTRDNWRLLGDCWYTARERKRAVGPLRRAAEMEEDGEGWLRLGQILQQEEDWAAADEAFGKAIAKGGLDDPGQALLLQGAVRFYAERFGDAQKTFELAAKYPKHRRAAQSWRRLVNQELNIQ